ncbi:MAG: ubiquitin-like domain-containing protein [Clostridiaceae bacterium]
MNTNKKNIAILTSILLLLFVLFILIKSKQKTVTIVIGNDTKTITTYDTNVEKVLSDEGIILKEKDKVSPSLESALNKTDTITVTRAKNLTVKVDGKEVSVLSSDRNVGEMLKSEEISVGSDDKISPEATSELTEGMEVKITRITSKTLTKSVSIDYSTDIKPDSELLDIFKKKIQSGIKGEKQITYKVLYEDGKEISREVAGEKIVKEPVNEVIIQGTQKSVALSRGGEPISFSKKLSCRTTAYWAVNGVGSTYTCSGKLAVRNSQGYSTVAVDTSVIPLGTKMYIPGYGFAIAADTGSAIIGNTIDVYFNTKAEALNWAVKNLSVYILN